ncbi:hypothetical protein ARC20_10530 [Stenotrophomonas panacihumi]|uniref:Uncharacterized protein n=1 Tax=Stenotrophomonas panacihumi TaxID=676599 RepID=A0A0R0AMV3_9GAMM|nr:hypothetical protein ARC20_10530 [Stenotrophomonas panacihumi]PTN55609.1 hypothetical protein C9J98_03215 [Stenotrophomonas panacihumi]
MLALAMLLNPALTVIGDAHAALVGASLHAHEANAAQGPQASEPAADSLLFALEHAAHCCAHVTADNTVLPLAAPAWSTRERLPRPAALPLAVRRTSLLRPPIG